MPDAGDISVIRARSQHVDVLSRFRGDFWHDQSRRGLLEAFPDHSAAATSKLIDRPRTHILVAEDASGVVQGYLFGQTRIVPGVMPTKVSSVEEVYVSEEMRGKGIAERLAKLAVQAFKDDGADRIQLRVLCGNHSGISFWSNLGFRPYLSVFELPSSKSE